MGIYLGAQKAFFNKEPVNLPIEGETKQKQMASLLCCPLDKSKVILEHDYLCYKKERRYKLQYPAQ